MVVNNITQEWQAYYHYGHTQNEELFRTANLSMQSESGVDCLFGGLILGSCKGGSNA